VAPPYARDYREIHISGESEDVRGEGKEDRIRREIFPVLAKEGSLFTGEGGERFKNGKPTQQALAAKRESKARKQKRMEERKKKSKHRRELPNCVEMRVGCVTRPF